jgi:hypothetical protein
MLLRAEARAMNDFLPAMPHGPITETFPDVFVVTGGFRFAPGLSITRNMTIVRQGKSLVLINSVRLTGGAAELEQLGRSSTWCASAFHADGTYYVAISAQLWAPAKPARRGISSDHELTPSSTPIESVAYFYSRRTRARSRLAARATAGARIATAIKTGRPKAAPARQARDARDGLRAHADRRALDQAHGARRARRFRSLLDQPFEHLIPGHGTPLRNDAKPGLKQAIAQRFGPTR